MEGESIERAEGIVFYKSLSVIEHYVDERLKKELGK